MGALYLFAIHHHGTSGSALQLSLFQLLPQPFNFFLELSKHGILGIFIDLWLVLDFLGAASVAQGGKGFIVVVCSGAAVRNHHCFGVATKGILSIQTSGLCG